MTTIAFNSPLSQPLQVNNPTQPSPTPDDLPRQKNPKYRNHHEPLIPGLPYNPGVERYVSRATEGFKTASQSTSEIIRAELQKRWGKDIDPDNTFITTFNYDPTLRKPPGGKVLNQISLTEAALHNMRHKNKHNEHQTPDEKAQSTLHKWINRLAPLAAAPIAIYNIVHTLNEPKTYEGIFVGPQPGGRQVYNSTTQLAQTPATFRDIVWNTELSKPYAEFLNGFWPAHEQKYAQLSKAAFVGAAMKQFDNDSLSESDVSLAMRAAGLPTNKTWSGMTLNDLDAATQKDPNVETGLLKINGFKSTDLMYITDKQTKTTLLHIPGNSSPIHRFDSQEQMKNWLAEQAADPVKREALSMHFPLRDQADRALSEGVNQTLVGISGWPKKDAPDAGVLERLNQYNPQTFITTEPLTEDPFKAMTTRQKERSYADAETQITTDGDVTKTTILEALETATKVAVMMTPLALVMPEVAIALEVFYLASGAAEVGIGADNIKHGKQGGSDQVVFGVLNALPVVAGGTSRLIKGAAGAEVKVGEVLETPVHTPEPPSSEPRPHSSGTQEPVGDPIPSEPVVDYSKVPINISKHAVTEGEQLLKGVTPNAKGIYQVKSSTGEDRWFIRYTDATGQPNVYEVRGNFNLRDGRVHVIDPQTGKQVIPLRATLDGEWAREIGPGGKPKWPWQRTPSPTPSDELKTPSKFSDQFVEADGSKMAGTAPLDDYFEFDKNTDYVLSSVGYEENAVIKKRLYVSWTLEEKNYAVLPGEKAAPSGYGSNDYSHNFINDINRDSYTVETNVSGKKTQHPLTSTAKSAPEIKTDKINQLEQLIPAPELRTLISEIAHQGSMEPAMKNFLDHRLSNGDLKKGLLIDDTFIANDISRYHIEYDPTNKVTRVTASGEYRLNRPEEGKLDNVKIAVNRTFTIHHTNDAENPYVLDKNAPTKIEIAITPS